MKDKTLKHNHFNPMALREKYSINKKKKNNFSKFWLDDGWDNIGSVFDEEDTKPKVDLITLASYRRAIANFVSIVTKDPSIKVTFNSHGDHTYTDGEEVTISANLDDRLFDSTVGLALHEGSHIKLSDFAFLKNLEFEIPKEYIDRSELKGFKETEVIGNIKNLLNYVEDRRIDHYIFSTSPGYKGYYHSMYDKYFYSKVIDKALKSDEYTDENIESYMFRIINLTNKNTNLDALNGLRKIWKLIDVRNINRLNTTEESFKVALDVYDVILNNVPDGTEKVNDDTGEVSYERADGKKSNGAENESHELSDEEFDDLLEAIEKGDVEFGEGSDNGVSIDMDDEENESMSSNGDNVGENKDSDSGGSNVKKKKSEVTLSDNQRKQLENAIKKQNKFLDKNIQKKKLSKKNKYALDAVESSGMKYIEVGKDFHGRWDDKKTPTKVIVVKKLTKDLIDSNEINMLSTDRWVKSEISYYVREGIRLGTILGRKLQVRGETKETKWTRKDNGKIDKRLIAELGFENERVFSTKFVDSYPDATLHISVDASGSMHGDKWTKTMTSVVAICKAASMIQNVDVIVSFRSTQYNYSSRRGGSNEEYPIMLIAYDSKVDNFNKVKNLFSYIRASGTTPEGLCFEAVLNEIISTSQGKDSYLLNFSDGMPMFGNNDIDYHGDRALNHTKKMVDEIRKVGIKVLSYFVSSTYDSDGNLKSFTRMYGKDAKNIDVTNVVAVAKTMNKRFLSKD